MNKNNIFKASEVKGKTRFDIDEIIQISKNNSQ